MLTLLTLISLSPDSQCVRVSIPEFKGEKAQLKVTVGDAIVDERQVSIKPHALMTTIETSKAVYRPNELVQIRLVTFDRWLKPVDELISRVWIENSRGLVVMQWNNVRTNNGIASLTFPVSSDNLYGSWKVKATSGNVLVAEKTFRIEEHDQPKAVISIEDKEFIALAEDEPQRRICVTNKLGHPLEGKLVVRTGYQGLDSNLPMDVLVSQINGCKDITINATAIGMKQIGQRTVTLDIEFTDKDHHFTQERSFELPISSRSLLIAFPSTKMTKSYFKAGLPYFGKVLVHRPDYTPAADQQVKITVEPRKQPWISQEESAFSAQFTSNKEGIVDFELPPFSKEIKQVFIKVAPVDQPEQTVAFTLRPWYSESKSELMIKPAKWESFCGDKVKVHLLITNTSKPVSHVYYQVIGRGHLEAPKKVALKMTKKDITSNGPFAPQQETTEFNGKQWTGSIEIKLPKNKASLTPMTRVVVFYPEEEKFVVADSQTVLVDCLNKGVDMQLKNQREGIEVTLKNLKKSKCSVELSNNQRRLELTKQKIMQLLERFDINHEYLLADKCSQRGQTQSFVQREQSLSPFRQSAIEYADSWDVFNEVGVQASSNLAMDVSPCEKEIYVDGYPSEVLRGMDTDRPLLWTPLNKDLIEAQALLKLEESLVDDLIYWNDLQRREKEQIAHQGDMEDEVYASAVCFDEQEGLRIGSTGETRKNPFSLKSEVPEQAAVGELVSIRAYIQRHGEKNLPLKLKLKTSTPHLVDLVESEKEMCIQSDDQVMEVSVRPKAIGKISLEIEAVKSPVECANAESQIEGSTSRRSIHIFPKGAQHSSTTSKLICPAEFEQKVPELAFGKSASISANLAEVALEQSKKNLQGERSAIDVLASFAPFVHLIKDRDVRAQSKPQMKKEMITAYQSLITYRLPDGSYTLFGGRKAIGDLALTTEVVKALTQAADLLPFTNDHELAKSIHWIHSRQQRDGRFTASRRQLAFWPMNITNDLEMTSFVVSSLLEAGHPAESIPMVNALQYIRSTEAEDEQKPMMYAMRAYIEALQEKNEEAKKYLRKLEQQQEQGKWTTAVLAYQTLAKRLVDEDIDALKVAEQLVQDTYLWQSPIKSRALVKIWKQITSSAPLNVEYGQTQFTLNSVAKETFQLESDEKIKLHGQGCSILTIKKERSTTSTGQNNYKVTVSGLDLGYSTCQKRLMRICVKERNKSGQASSPVMKVQLASGYQVDQKYLRQSLMMQPATLLNHFRVYGRDAYLYLKFLNGQSIKSQCLELPLVQTASSSVDKDGYIQVYNYNQGRLEHNQMVDVVSYTIPAVCDVVPIEQAKSQEKRHFQPLEHRRGNQQLGPLRVIDCPEEVEETCPVCESEEGKVSHEKVCSKKIAGLTTRIPWRHTDYEFIGSPESIEKKGKCLAVPLFMHKRVATSGEEEGQLQTLNQQQPEQQLMPLYMRAECQCPLLNQVSDESQLLLVKDSDSEEVSQKMQLTSEDRLILVPREKEITSCTQLRRSRRSATCDLTIEAPVAETLISGNKFHCGNEKQVVLAEVTEQEGCMTLKIKKSNTNLEEGKIVTLANKPDDKLKGKTVLIIAPKDHFTSSSPKLDVNVMVIKNSSEEQYDSYYQCSEKGTRSLTQSDAPYAASYSAPAPAPAYAAPAPAYAAPAPSYAAPSYSAPAPAYAAPSYSAPAPSYAAPSYSAPASYAAPAYSAPAPSYAAPSYSAPAPSYAAPSYSAPAPSYSAPASYAAPSYSAPASYAAPAYSAPAPSYAAPSYSAPAPSYAAPAYSAPAPSYAAPSYSAPAPSYAAPSYSAPAPSYSAPASYAAPSYSAPAPSYAAPSYSAPSYSAPAPSYAAPSYSAPSYSAPAPAYAAPSYSAPAPSYAAPSYSAPSYAAPAPSYAAPSYSAPASYAAPSYSAPAPSYAAPSYAAPSYSAPASYAAPSYSAPASYDSYEMPSYGYMAAAPSYAAPAASYGAPSYSAPSYSAPSYSAPAPSYAAPSYSAPASYAAPSYSAPSYSAPASYAAPAYSAPAPSYAAPSYSAPAPSYAAPSYSAPASYAAPSYSAPASYAAPSYSAPASYAAPSYSAPASYAAPSYSAPSYSAPSYSAPASYAAPSYSAPAPSYAAPSYSAPASYAAPSYSAPAASYAAPSYAAPSYSAPAYEVAAAPPMYGDSYGSGYESYTPSSSAFSHRSAVGA